MKEFFRKQLVKLKRKPQTIALVFIVLSCMVFTFNMTDHSNTIIYCSIQEGPSRLIPLMMFGVTLLSILSIFTHTGAYGRNGVKPVMLALVYLMLVLQAAMDVAIIKIVELRVAIYMEGGRTANQLPSYIASSNAWMWVHVAFLVITVLAMAFMPVYHRALLKVNTTVEEK